jgi:hypothetical protein
LALRTFVTVGIFIPSNLSGKVHAGTHHFHED